MNMALWGKPREPSLKTTSLGAGYGYTGLLTGTFFLHISVLAGLGPQQQEIQFLNAASIEKWNVSNKTSVRSTLGWSGHRTFGGLQFVFDSTNFQLENEILSFNSVLAFFFVGFSFVTKARRER
jgi:hypothetical protein